MPSLFHLPSLKRPRSSPWLPKLLPPPPQGFERTHEAKDKGKGKGSKPPSNAKDAAKAKEAEAKAKEAEAKIKKVDPKAKDTPTSQLSQKEDSSPPKAKA